MNREEKKLEIDHIADCIAKAKIAVVADYKGLTVEQVTNLRKQLRAADCDARVVKNTLTKLALAKVYKDDSSEDLSKLASLFEGTNMFLFSYKNIVEPTKVLTKFAKERESFKLKGAWFEGKFLGQAEVDELSNMPSREELLAKLLCLINAPATQLLRVMKAPAEQVARLVEAVRKTKEA